MLVGARAGAAQPRALARATQPAAHAEGRPGPQAGRDLVLVRPRAAAATVACAWPLRQDTATPGHVRTICICVAADILAKPWSAASLLSDAVLAA